jgi:hypothetical protein
MIVYQSIHALVGRLISIRPPGIVAPLWRKVERLSWLQALEREVPILATDHSRELPPANSSEIDAILSPQAVVEIFDRAALDLPLRTGA